MQSGPPTSGDTAEAKTIQITGAEIEVIHQDAALVKRVDLDTTLKQGAGTTAELSDHVRSFLIDNETPQNQDNKSPDYPMAAKKKVTSQQRSASR